MLEYSRKRHCEGPIGLLGVYLNYMARGWESKSVEAQIEMAEARTAGAKEKMLNLEELDRIRRRETIQLSRTRVLRELDAAQNPRYKGVLNKALADLDAKLATFASV